MADGRTTGGSLRRRLFALALAGYVVLLYLAAWPSPLRPGLVDAPSKAAQRLLGRVGMQAGQRVFRFDEVLEYGTVADCTFVRGIGADGDAVVLWPPGGRCHDRGVRLRMPPREIVQYRALLGALVQRRNPAVASGFMGAVGRSFCGIDADGPAFASIDVVWIRSARRYDDAQLMRQPVLAYSWDCSEARVVRPRWHPDEAGVRAFWGGEPWP